MKLTIDISDALFNGIVENKYGIYNGRYFDMIRNGTLLPKSHGRLIDADRFQKYCFNKNFEARLSDSGLAIINLYLDFQPTFIEAESEDK